jgi:hypothetical protein
MVCQTNACGQPFRSKNSTRLNSNLRTKKLVVAWVEDYRSPRTGGDPLVPRAECLAVACISLSSSTKYTSKKIRKYEWTEYDHQSDGKTVTLCNCTRLHGHNRSGLTYTLDSFEYVPYRHRSQWIGKQAALGRGCVQGEKDWGILRSACSERVKPCSVPASALTRVSLGTLERDEHLEPTTEMIEKGQKSTIALIK